jgi:branched-chain amino acid transport system permease protein
VSWPWRLAGWALFVLAGPALLALAGQVPFLTSGRLVFLAITALAAVGLCLIMGFAGQVSLGHAAFYAVGAYASGILTAGYGVPPIVALLAGMVLAGAAAAGVARAVFRVSGHFLAMATLAFGLILYYSLGHFRTVTGGNAGRGGIPKLAIGSWEATTDTRMFLLCWALVVLGVLVARNVVDSRTGRALRATGASEVAAGCCGVNVVRAKVGVFVLGALYAAVAGSLYAHYVTYIAPEEFGLLKSIQFLVVATVGGLTSVWGGPVGAVVLVLLTEASREAIPLFVEGATGPYELTIYGLVLVVVLLLFNRGIAGGIAHAWRARGRGGGGDPEPLAEDATGRPVPREVAS